MAELYGTKHLAGKLLVYDQLDNHSLALEHSQIKRAQQKTVESDMHQNCNHSLLDKNDQLDNWPKDNEVCPNNPLDLTQILKRQIELLETNEDYQAKLRYESEAYVLSKRRNNLFRSFERWEDTEEKSTKEEGAIILDQQINRKKITTKNSIKIQKLLNSFLTKNYAEEQKLGDYLEFISSKHKIPLQMTNINNSLKKQPNITNTQIGYVKFYQAQKQNDIRKVKKYQLVVNRIPTLGITYDLQAKIQPVELTEDDFKNEEKNTNIEIFEEGVDCFENRIPEKGYLLPEHPLYLQFLQNKRQIFKISRQFIRQKQQREAQSKKLANLCMKQLQNKYIRSIKIQNESITRAKKLHRQCLIYWRKREKELTEVKKKKEKLEAELKKRQEEQQQAKKQQKRLQYIMYQSGLYSHFMATKLGMDVDHKKELQKASLPNDQNIQIDEEAAQLTVNQIINNKQQNLEKFAKPEEKLDLSSVDQGKLSELVSTPVSFQGTLKQYQIKGLRWLNNLFEQGINGILADQMGLGKTIQAISLLAHVSHTKNIWGPFLIVAPNSTLFNWQQQFQKFCPSLRVLPYWGNIKQRKTLRKFFSPKKFTQKADSPFHVVITSYQLTVTDDKVFKKMKWQFMILDEAQAIKNVLSQRWNTLKQFQSRNRLLLTGTPIQNNMAELWALLNFVMPDLFDSHELFNEWFSKDIQAHSQDAKQLDQIKIQRLHAILKPFMLRRVKKDVEHEIGKKIEHQILCEMTKRQKLLYDSIKQKLNVKQLFKMFQSKAKVENLMNLVMQLRKVCNHPELFQRRPAISPFQFQAMYYYTGYIPIKAGDIKLLSFSSRNPISFDYPKLAYDQLEKYEQASDHKCKRLLNIFSVKNQFFNPTFSFGTILGLSRSEIQLVFKGDSLFSGILLAHWMKRNAFSKKLSTKQNLLIFQQFQDKRFRIQMNPLFYREINHAYIPNASSAPIEADVSSCSFTENKKLMKQNKYFHFLLYGKYKERFQNYFKSAASQISQSFKGLLHDYPSLTKIQVINFGNLIADSSKLKELDRILKQKKKNGDKVLIFCQMTKMIDILEDFMNMRKYSFFRLDGACNISDRRDMVNQFQKPTSKTFVFLLSTRAGGLGVTLTAANTVIFYDNDWNPTMDAQATDRAHRIGQSRDVNVYQLVTKGTIEERIVKRAQQKKNVQSTVYEGASFNFFKKDMILQLMVDQFDQNGNAVEEKTKKDGKQKKKGKPSRPREQNQSIINKSFEGKENQMMRRIDGKQKSEQVKNDSVDYEE